MMKNSVPALLALSFIAACGDGPTNTPPRVGVLEVRVATSGERVDADGYQVQVDGGTPLTVQATSVTSLSEMAEGSHTVDLSGIAPNCTPRGGPNQNVNVAARATATVSFQVDCVASGTIRVATTTVGLAPDGDGYLVRVGNESTKQVATNGTASFESVPVGNQTVTLTGLAQNCVAQSENPRTVMVGDGSVTDVTFQVRCPGLGTVRVGVTSTGSDLDVDGYAVQLDAGAPVTVPQTGAHSFSNVAEGTRTIHLSGVAANCMVAGGPSRSVVVAEGADLEVAFNVRCYGTLAFDFEGEIYTVTGAGSDLRRLTNNAWADGQPAWSADGTKIAFTSNRSGTYDLWVMNADGSNPVRLFGGTGVNDGPDWSPDGTRIVFTRGSSVSGTRSVWLMNADGSGAVALTGQDQGYQHPQWSPDGSVILFNGVFTTGLFSIRPDGTAMRRVTTVSEFYPSWSPDGRRVAVQSFRAGGLSDIWVIDADGTNPVRLTTDPEVDGEPDWSPDGATIAFTSKRLTGRLEVFVMDADGQNQRRVVQMGGSTNTSGVAWKPLRR
jgi:hypothetical protein